MLPLDFASLAKACERAQAEAMVELAREARPVADGWMTYGGPGAFVNKACGLGLSGPLKESVADEVLAFFGGCGAEPRVELCPFVHPSLLASLGRAGFQLREFENVLVRPLAEAEDSPPAGPPGLELELVDPSDARAAETYVRTSWSGFFPDGQEPPVAFREAALKAVQLKGYDSLLARLGGEVVGAGGCASRRGTTALFGVSVLPAFRGQGIQTALILARLARARARRSSLATIVSHPGLPTERNAQRLGFQLAYVRAVLVRPETSQPSAP